MKVIVASKVDRLSQQIKVPYFYLARLHLLSSSLSPSPHYHRHMKRDPRVYALRKRVGEGCPDRFRRYNEPVFPIALHTCLPLHRIMRFFTDESVAENNKSFELKILRDEKYILSPLQKTDIFRSRNMIDCCEIIIFDIKYFTT